MNISEILAIASGVVYIFAFLDYNLKVVQRLTKPNGTAWFIWSIISAVSITSYLKMSGDAWKSVIPLLNILLCVATFLLAVTLKKFRWPDKWDLIALGLGIFATVVWKHYDSAKYANLIVQLAILAGFVPLWRMLRVDPEIEQPRPWLIWSFGYILATIVVILRWKGQWYDLVYPINCIILHSSVPILGLMIRRIKTQRKEIYDN